RRWVSQDCGSFHIISRLTGSNNLFTIEEKEYLLTLMERLAAGFFISIHAFCIMSNHIHILATGMELEAQEATSEELLRRYKLMFGKERQKGTAKKRSAPT
ncbi:MAG: Tnp protein, partial [Acidobacteriota bacterium]|nr:Tnp protein [Acidobacteriota bacterium]